MAGCRLPRCLADDFHQPVAVSGGVLRRLLLSRECVVPFDLQPVGVALLVLEPVDALIEEAAIYFQTLPGSHPTQSSRWGPTVTSITLTSPSPVDLSDSWHSPGPRSSHSRRSGLTVAWVNLTSSRPSGSSGPLGCPSCWHAIRTKQVTAVRPARSSLLTGDTRVGPNVFFNGNATCRGRTCGPASGCQSVSYFGSVHACRCLGSPESWRLTAYTPGGSAQAAG